MCVKYVLAVFCCLTVTGAYSHYESMFYIPQIKGQCEKLIIDANTDGHKCDGQTNMPGNK